MTNKTCREYRDLKAQSEFRKQEKLIRETKMRELLEAGWSCKTIASQLGIEKNAVWQFAKKTSVCCSKVDPPNISPAGDRRQKSAKHTEDWHDSNGRHVGS